MNKKAIAILGVIFVLIVGTLGFLIYQKYFNKPVVVQNPTNPTPAPLPPSPSPATPQPQPTPSASSNLFKLTNDQVVSPVLFFDGSGVDYFDNRGNLYEALFKDDDGRLSLTSLKQLSIPTRTNINKILWPPKGEDFIAQLKDSSGNIAYSYFQKSTQTFTDLPPQVTSLSWMPNGKDIVYVWVENGKATLNLGSADMKKYINLGEMWETDDHLFASPNGDQILYYRAFNFSGENPINSVTVDGKIWKTLVSGGDNFGILWSPDGHKFLFVKKDLATQRPELWVYNLVSAEVKSLGVFTTTEKAVWSSDSSIVYAAIPNSGNAGANSLTVDSFFQIDVSTLGKKPYVTTGAAIDGRDLFLNNKNDKLFFRNAQDGGLYYLDLMR